MLKKVLLTLFIFSFIFTSNAFALEEIVFPDGIYIQDSDGGYIKKDEYEKKLKAQQDKIEKEKNTKTGYATYYGTTKKFQGKKTASGELFNRNLMTAAMNGIAFGTKLKVTNLLNNKTVIVKVNDRMGSSKNIIDLSSGAFSKISNLSAGRIKVSIEIIKN